VVGFDNFINYFKYCYASLCLQNGAIFIGTNEDASMAVGERKMPGGGTMVRGLAKCSEIEPVIVGKPNPTSINIACEKFGLDKKKCILVGDRMDTDIMMGYTANIDTFLVLTGVTTEEKMKQIATTNEKMVPTYYYENLS